MCDKCVTKPRDDEAVEAVDIDGWLVSCFKSLRDAVVCVQQLAVPGFSGSRRLFSTQEGNGTTPWTDEHADENGAAGEQTKLAEEHTVAFGKELDDIGADGWETMGSCSLDVDTERDAADEGEVSGRWLSLLTESTAAVDADWTAEDDITDSRSFAFALPDDDWFWRLCQIRLHFIALQ